MESLIRDLRHSLRTIGRMPVLATVIVLSLGVGIGVNTTVFSWLQMMLLQPLPGVRNAATLRLVEPLEKTGSHPGMSWLEYRDMQVQVPALQGLIATRMIPMNLGEAPRTERGYGQLVSGNFFTALGLEPALGRFIRPDEAATPGGAPVVVISHTFWQNHFAGGTDVLGKTLRVNDRTLTIVGVAPERFQGTILGLSFDLWAPATLAPLLISGSRELEDRGLRGYMVMGRVAPGATAEQAQGQLDAAMQRLAEAYPETNGAMKAELLTFWKAPRGPQRMLIGALGVLQAVMILLLLAVCGNTANLVLARASARQREIGVRRVLGAGRWRVVSLLLTENLVLALAGAGVGIAIAVWGTQALRAVPMIGSFPIRFQTQIDGIGLAFAALLGIACGLAFGLAPAVQLTRMDPQVAIRMGFNTAPRSRLRNALMSLQVALALVVLLVAGLFLKNFRESRDIDPGFKVAGVLLGAYDLSPRNVDSTASRLFAAQLLEKLAALPNVEVAAIATSVPLDIHGMGLRSFAVEGRARADATPDRSVSTTVTPGYFKVMGIPIKTGVDFAALTDASAPPQAIVNEEFVKRYLDGGEPLGRRILARGGAFTIAGVVRNSTYDSFGESAQPIVYYSYRDRPSDRGEIHVRARAGSEAALGPEVQRVVRELDASLPVYDVRTMAEHIDKNLFLRRIPARMFVVLGPLLLLLAAIGIYAVVAYTVAHRTNEIGLRLALGASARRVVTLIMKESMSVIAGGALLGWLVALLVQMHAGGGRPISLSIFLGVPAILMAVAAFACWLPAHRATRIDPMVALRRE